MPNANITRSLQIFIFQLTTRILISLICLQLLSCKEERIYQFKEIESHDFSLVKEKIFEYGSVTHLTDSCSFLFACDCCKGELVLNADSSFYYIDYCMSDVSVQYGEFYFKHGQINLEFKEYCIKKEYNWGNEVDSSAQDYFIKEINSEALNLLLVLRKCDNKTVLDYPDGEQAFIGLEIGDGYDERIQFLSENGFLERMKL